MYFNASESSPRETSNIALRPIPAIVREHANRREKFQLIYELFCYSAALVITVLAPPVMHQHLPLAALLRMRVSIINIGVTVLALAAWSILLVILPRRRTRFASWDVLFGIVLRVISCSGIAMLSLMSKHEAQTDLEHLTLFFCVSLALILLGEVTVAAVVAFFRAAHRDFKSVLIIGSGSRGRRLANELKDHPKYRYVLLGFVDPEPAASTIPVLGGLDSLETLLMSHAVDEVIVALPIKSMYDDAQLAVTVCERVGVPCRYQTDLFKTEHIKNRTIDPQEPQSVGLLHMAPDDSWRSLKRVLDIIAAAAGLLLLSPVLLATMIAIRLTSKGPIFFRQQRYGLNKRLFTIYKFRTMVVDAERLQANLEHLNENDGAAFKLKNDPRVTSVGQFLRKTSLDELPQLWNVLVGNMSLVGPRPLPVRDVSRFSEGWLMRRFSVPPGITGLWQVSGRSNTSFFHWMKLDLEYIDQWSFTLDLEILARTVPAVLRKDGAV